MKIVQVLDKNQILDFLNQDRIYAAYAICDLAPERFRHGIWFIAYDNGEAVSLAMSFVGTNPNFVFTMGRGEPLGEIFKNRISPHRAYVAVHEENLAWLREFYDFDKVEHMIRMNVDPAAFESCGDAVERLGPEDLVHLNRLYQLSGDKSLFSSQLQRGIYYGLRINGKLISAAGTHLVSPAYKMAAVGNVMTAEGSRNRGYATACTSAVVGEAIKMGLDVVLNVSADNPAALRVYKKVGFVEHCSYYEVKVTRKLRLLSKAKSILDLFVGEEENKN